MNLNSTCQCQIHSLWFWNFLVLPYDTFLTHSAVYILFLFIFLQFLYFLRRCSWLITNLLPNFYSRNLVQHSRWIVDKVIFYRLLPGCAVCLRCSYSVAVIRAALYFFSKSLRNCRSCCDYPVHQGLEILLTYESITPSQHAAYSVLENDHHIDLFRSLHRLLHELADNVSVYQNLIYVYKLLFLTQKWARSLDGFICSC